MWSAGAKMWTQHLFCGETQCQPGDHPDMFALAYLIVALLQFGTRALFWVSRAQQNCCEWRQQDIACNHIF